MRVAYFALTGQEHEHVAARILGSDFVQRDNDLLDRAGIFALRKRAPAYFDRIAAAFDLDDRRIAEMLRKYFGVDRRRCDDQFQIAPACEQAFEITEQKIDIEVALVRLVKNQGVVGVEPGIGLRFRQQNAVSHELDQRVRAELFGETHLITDHGADFRTEFAGHTPRDAARSDPARLGAAD